MPEGFRSSYDVRVRFAETDAQGIAHHASHVIWLEVARVAYWAEHAGGYRAIQEQGLGRSRLAYGSTIARRRPSTTCSRFIFAAST